MNVPFHTNVLCLTITINADLFFWRLFWFIFFLISFLASAKECYETGTTAAVFPDGAQPETHGVTLQTCLDQFVADCARG